VKLDQLNKLLTLAANFGILASIVFLGTQIQQNSQMMEVQALTMNTAAHVQLDLAGIGDNPAPAFQKYFSGSSDLSDEELIIVGTWLSANSWQFRNSYHLYELGIISEEAWQSELVLIAGYYGTPIGRAFWNAGKPFYRAQYVEAVESAVNNQDRTATTWMESVRAGVIKAREGDSVTEND